MAKGFRYTLDREQIKKYMKLTPEEKLTWLEEIFIFSEKVLTPQAKKVRECFRKERYPEKIRIL